VLNVIKEQKGTALVIFLTGSIEESVDFSKIIGPPVPEMITNCKGITRINSIGVKAWIKYFQSAQQSGSKLTFIECSTAIVEQINLISNFLCGGSVESIFVPFSCTNCKSELVGLFKAEAIKRANMNIPPLKCSKCGGQAAFDDIPEEYFGFLSR
jgi:anti-anti-sigma regulatory factor